MLMSEWRVNCLSSIVQLIASAYWVIPDNKQSEYCGLVLPGFCFKLLFADALFMFLYKMEHTDKCITGIVDLFIQDRDSVFPSHLSLPVWKALSIDCTKELRM